MRPLVIALTLIGFSSVFAQKWTGKEPGNETGPVGPAYDKAIAPYVAKARATYPAAKKRYLAGLPQNHRFYVWTRLSQVYAKRKEVHFEDIFVSVDAIKSGKIYGTIANTVDFVTNYRRGDRLQFPESDVMNWVIVRPDGSEEGNFVGKFLEHWKKPQ